MGAVSVLCLLAMSLSLVVCLDPSLDAEWMQWNLKFQKPNRRAADTSRREIWEDNYKFIQDHNERFRQGNETFEMALNTFADMNEDEFAAFARSTPIARTPRTAGQTLTAQELRRAASFRNTNSIDYRQMGYVTPVENQGYCGSCWAFSALGALEAQYKKRTGRLIRLSKQQLVDCTSSVGNRGCNGGWPGLTYNYIMRNGGVQSERSYPYYMRDGYCRANPRQNVVMVRDWKYLPAGDEQALQDGLVTIGPVAIVMDSSTRNFQFYRGGVFYDPKCSSSKQTHAMLLVGFGRDGWNEYWTIKNSWGPWWGERGYIRLAKNRQAHCGISNYGVVPYV